MKTKMTNRQKQAIRTKNKIFDTTVSLISENGFDNVNIEDICKTAEVSVGTVITSYSIHYTKLYETFHS